MATIPLTRGILLAIEGIDGSGKTTQTARLAELLGEIFDVVTTKEPTRGQWGQKLRESAQTGRLAIEDEYKLFLRDREEHVADLINPSLDAGKIIIVDRYYFSTMAYQGARGMDPAQIQADNEQIAPKPDLLVILDVPPDVGLARIRARGDKANLFEERDALAASRAIFNKIEGEYVVRIDGTQNIEDVTRCIVDALMNRPIFRELCAKSGYLERCEPFPCGFLDICKWIKARQDLHQAGVL